MNQRWKKIFIIKIFIATILIADDSEIDNLLNVISVKDDLSKTTKLENGGISYIYTREDIQKMQAHNLKDILKSTYPFGYDENRFAISDPYALRSKAPFLSSSLRVYIDDQEITSGLYGSGMIVYGDMDIDFVDHIEVYTGNPTFEFSAEPANTIIKLYSKVAQRDDGSKISLATGSHGASSIYGYNTQELENNWSYFSYISHTDEKREQYSNKSSTLSKDKKTTHIFASIYDESNKILIDGARQHRDAFISHSLFATPDNSDIKADYLHIGYNGHSDKLSYLITYDLHNSQSDFTDTQIDTIKILNETNELIPYNAHTDAYSQSYTASAKYKTEILSNNILIGFNYRYKHFTLTNRVYNDIEFKDNQHTNQIISALFLEDQYSINDNKIITLGVSYTAVTNNHSNQDNNLFSFRTGYTFTHDTIICKTIVSHLETTLDPYLVNNSIYLADPINKIDTKKQDMILQNIRYKEHSNTYEFIGVYVKIKNSLIPDETGKLTLSDQDIYIKSILNRYTKEYNSFDKIELSFTTNFIDNLPNSSTFKQYFFTIRNFTTYNRFDFFNEILYYRDNEQNKNSYDYTAGVIYHYNDDLKISLKGTNILNKAKESLYPQLSTTTLEQDEPLSISPIDQSFMVTMGYTF